MMKFVAVAIAFFAVAAIAQDLSAITLPVEVPSTIPSEIPSQLPTELPIADLPSNTNDAVAVAQGNADEAAAVAGQVAGVAADNVDEAVAVATDNVDEATAIATENADEAVAVAGDVAEIAADNVDEATKIAGDVVAIAEDNIDEATKLAGDLLAIVGTVTIDDAITTISEFVPVDVVVSFVLNNTDEATTVIAALLSQDTSSIVSIATAELDMLSTTGTEILQLVPTDIIPGQLYIVQTWLVPTASVPDVLAALPAATSVAESLPTDVVFSVLAVDETFEYDSEVEYGYGEYQYGA